VADGYLLARVFVQPVNRRVFVVVVDDTQLGALAALCNPFLNVSNLILI